MLATPPESSAVLDNFVRKVQPAGPGWRRLRERNGVAPPESLLDMLANLVLSCAVLFGGLLGTGGFLLKQPLWGWGGLITLVLGLWALLERPRLLLAVRGR
jgi:hypothetical protein